MGVHQRSHNIVPDLVHGVPGGVHERRLPVLRQVTCHVKMQSASTLHAQTAYNVVLQVDVRAQRNQVLGQLEGARPSREHQRSPSQPVLYVDVEIRFTLHCLDQLAHLVDVAIASRLHKTVHGKGRKAVAVFPVRRIVFGNRPSKRGGEEGKKER